MFQPASQPEVIRCKQKDDYYCGLIRGNIATLAQYILGPRQWIKWHKEFDILADVGYFTLTTLAGLQTLGEEYVGNIQVISSRKAVPSIWRRFCMVIFQIGLPYGINRFLTYIEKRLNENIYLNISNEDKAKILNVISVIRNTVTILQRCHLAIFYWQGIFYHLAKRISGIHYIRVRKEMSNTKRMSNYKILALLCFLQLFFTFMQHLYKHLKVNKHKDTNITYLPGPASVNERENLEDMENSQASKCALCLEIRKSSTATPCGHLFCWNCIYEWCQTKPVCPLCREKFELSRLILLQNYN